MTSNQRQILHRASQHSFECMYNLPESVPKSSSLGQFNTIIWSKHCNSGTSSQVYTWHKTFYLIKHHATLWRYIHIYYIFSGFQLVCGVYSYPPPLPLPQTHVIFLAFTMMLSFFNYCIYSLCFHRTVCFILFFFFSVLVMFLFYKRISTAQHAKLIFNFS